MKNYLKKLSENLFSELKSDEELSLGLHSEESEFVRFTQSKVRQNTSVSQHELTLQFQADNRSYKSTSILSLDLATDTTHLQAIVDQLRKDLALIDENPKFIKMQNHGISEVLKKSQRPSTADVIKKISTQFTDSDLAGFYCAGPVRQASVNSAGQFHYYENDQFFFDYSIYDGPRAAKGFYSENNWDDSEFAAQAAQIKNTLSLLKKPQIKIKPGSYRTYLAPMAVAELVQIFNWRAVSRSAYEQGFAPLKKLYTKEKLFSPLFSLIENNELGLNSHFNSLGELSPQYLPIIENGELKNFLINTATAKEYNLVSNNADSGLWNTEGMRSAELKPGTLSEKTILAQLGTGLFLTNLHYINWSDPQAARITGMTRFACFWVENGEIVGPIQDLRFDDTLYNLFGAELAGLTEHQSTFVITYTYQKRSLGGMKVPGALINKMNFTL
ncbi:MAG: metallopeptidase TldD-related protein [Bdellovibrionota bacterium]